MPDRPYPLLLEPIYKEKVWGGRSLEGFGRRLPGTEATLIGESWEVADLAATAPSGGGGGAARSTVRNGRWAGTTLHDLLRTDVWPVMGAATLAPTGGFPLLVKYLDARENLSVQVHPSPRYARDHAGAELKSEAWYVVAAEPGATIYKGLRPGVTKELLAEAIADGGVPDVLEGVPARAGACHYLPSGTVHALGAGVLVAEVQTPSDTTFRVFDWGRGGRELHVAQALESLLFVDPPAATSWDRSSGSGAVTLATTPNFAIEERRVVADEPQRVAPSAAEVWMWLDGAGEIVPEEGEAVALGALETAVVPGGGSAVEVRAKEAARMLRVTLPVSEEESTP